MAPPAFARQVKVNAADSKYFAGVPGRLLVQVSGFEASPEPTVTVESPPGCSLAQMGAPGKNSQTFSINGRVSSSVTYTYTYQFLAEQPGRYTVGPFVARQGGREQSSGAGQLQVEEFQSDPRVEFKLSLPEKPVAPGQRVRIAVEWRLDAELLENHVDYQALVPLFGMTSSFDFVDEREPERGRALECFAGAERTLLSITSETFPRNGKPWALIRAERILVPRRPGTYAVAASFITVDEVTRWGRDFFGGRTPAATRKVFARDVAREIVVSDLPSAGRPPSFTGAVGTGFAVEVSADRSVVRMGDPIRLTVRVRGDGQLEEIGLPPLAGPDQLDPTLFRLAADEISGKYEHGQKTFELTVRALSERVREVPPLSFSWFNPDSQSYETARSLPIALQVRAGETIGATEVVSTVPPPASSGSAAAPARSDGAGAGTAATSAGSRARDFSLTGADLSIVSDPRLLIAPSSSGRAVERATQAILYSLSLACVAWALIARRRADLDPKLLARRRTLTQQLADIAVARDVADLAGCLRRLIALAPEAARARQADALLAECEAIAFAPSGAALSEEQWKKMRGRAEDLARHLLGAES